MENSIRKTCWISGGSGLIGSHTLRHLSARGWTVRALVRQPGDFPAGVQVIRGDLHAAGSWEESLDGVDVAIHAAAVADDWGPYRALRAASRQVHERFFQTLVARKVRRLVLVSAATVYGAGLTGVVDEDQPFRITGELCGDTKIDSEQLAWQFHHENLFDLVVIRPVTCYGRGDRHFLPRLTQDLREQRSAWVGGGEFPANLCHADNVGRLIAVAADHPSAKGQAFHVRDSALMPWRQFVGLLCRNLDRPPPSRNIPVPLAALLARMMTSIASWLHFRSPPPLTPHAVDILTSRAEYSIRRAEDLLGFRPQWDTTTGIGSVIGGQ